MKPPLDRSCGGRKGDPDLMALPLESTVARTKKPRLISFFCLEEADVGNLRLVVERESLTFPAVIDGDVVAVDGFDATGKGTTFSFLSDEFVRGEGQEEGNDKGWANGVHGVETYFC